MGAQTTFGYSADLEQNDGGELMRLVPLISQSGFTRIWVSDHFHPWFHRNAHTGFAWSWIPEALVSSESVSVGTGVTAPIYRYHPAVIAQAAAYLSNRFAGRFFLGVGTGESMNEAPLGLRWGGYDERADRLCEAIRIMRALWNEDFVNFDGEYYKLSNANVYTKPRKQPPVFVAANGPKTAHLAGQLGDGLITFEAPDSFYRMKLFPSFEKGASEAGKKPETLDKIIQLIVSFDENFHNAVEGCRIWAGALIGGAINMKDPRELDEIGKSVTEEQLLHAFLVCSSPSDLLTRFERFIDIGFNHIVVLNSSPDKEKLLSIMKNHIIPKLQSRAR